MNILPILGFAFAISALLLAFDNGVSAEPFSPNHVIRASFVLSPSPWQGAAIDEFDTIEFSVGLDPFEPIQTFTTKLYDGDELLGTYTGTDPGPVHAGTNSRILTGRFVAPGSLYSAGNPTIVDFTSIRNATIRGLLEFTIQGGRGEWFGMSDDLVFGRALGPANLPSWGVSPHPYQILEQTPAPVPEPATLTLLGVGLAATGWRARRRRRARATSEDDVGSL